MQGLLILGVVLLAHALKLALPPCDVAKDADLQRAKDGSGTAQSLLSAAGTLAACAGWRRRNGLLPCSQESTHLELDDGAVLLAVVCVLCVEGIRE